jgi:hypothetical protein
MREDFHCGCEMRPPDYVGNLPQGKEAFHSFASGDGCEARFGVKRDLT